MKMSQWLAVAGIVSAMCLGSGQARAQEQRDDRGRDGRGRFDPAEMQQRMLERYKEVLEVTDDTEWKAIQPLVSKVMEGRMANLSGMGRGMMFRRGGDRGPGGPPGGDNPDQSRRGPFGQPNPEADALQKAVDGKASNAEMKAAIAKFQESRKAKQAELEKAQNDLRKVLSVRQEAIATLNGLL